MPIINYDKKLKQLFRNLRKHSTLSEVLLWKRLNKKQIKGHRFLRQKPIDNYIVDFYCPKLMLAIEIDGETHFDQIEKDNERQKKLELLGIKFLRFGDKQVKNNISSVILEIEGWINAHG